MNVNGDAVFGPPGNDLFTTLDADLRRAVHGNQSLDALSAQLKTQTQTVQTAQANGRRDVRARRRHQDPEHDEREHHETEPVERRETSTWRRCS